MINNLLFFGSLVCLGLTIVFTIYNNLFLAVICIITSSFFSSTRKYNYLKNRIDSLNE